LGKSFLGIHESKIVCSVLLETTIRSVIFFTIPVTLVDQMEQKVKSTFDVAFLKVIHSTGVDGRKIAVEKNSNKDEGYSD
jgi:hypothetical protein